LNTEKGEASRRELKKLKQYVYYCCEDELGLLVKYVNPIPALSDSCELKLDEFYNVIKIEGDDYIIADETGEDWTYPSSMFEIISSNRVSNAFPQVKHKLAEQEMKNGDYQEAVSCAASVFGLIGDKDLIEEIRKLDPSFKTEQIFQCNSIADKEKKELKKIKLGIGEQKNATIKAIIDILKNDENKDNTISEIIKLLKNNKNGNKTITEIIQALENNDKNYKLETIKKMISLLQKSSNKEENLEKHKFLYDIINTKIIGKIKDSLFSLFIEREFTIFKEKWKDFFENSKFAEGDLLEGGIIKHFEKIVYRHRNRCAHNLVSYQENLPTLSTLSDKEYDYNNYFFRFSLLILIDEIFIKLYKKYIEALENNSYA
jgi:hypothetical protein